MKTLLFFIALLVFPVLRPMAQQSLRIMSYNIHDGIGLDNRTDYERIAGVIRQSDPDIVALQEVDSATQRAGGVDILHQLADYTLMHRLYAPAIPYQGGKYGIGLLSREKPLKTRYIALPGREEQRVLLIAEFEKYVFCCTHFSLTEADQLASIPLIIGELSQVTKPAFLAGDLNAHPDSPVLKALQKKFIVLTDPKKMTFPADKPGECLDYILGYTGNGSTYAVSGNRVVNEPLASDHRPVVTEVVLKTEVGRIFRTHPYLQRPVDEGITVSWLTRVPVYSWVEYGTDTANLQRAHTVVDGQVISNNTIHKIRLEPLKPGIRYYYRICSKEILSYRAYSKIFGDTAVSAFYSFTLPEENTGDFTALIFNDIHKHHQTLDVLYDQVRDIPYDFVLFNGDCIDDPANENEAVHSLSYFNEKVGAGRVPVFYLRGNHEIRNAYSIQLRELFDYVGNKTYGAFNWGDTRFVMLDCGEDKPDDHWVYYGLNDFTRLRNDQVGFLQMELTSKAFRNAGKRVLVHHIPLYGSTDEYQPCKDLWHGLLKKAAFNVALNAHTHTYAFHPKGSSGNNFPVFVGGGYSLEDATVMILSKQGNRMTIRVVNTKGETLREMDL